MIELRTKTGDYVSYFEGEIVKGDKYRNFKKTTTITGKIIIEKVATRKYFEVHIHKLLQYQYEELVRIFKHSNLNLELQDLNTGELFTNLFIDMEDLKLDVKTLALPNLSENDYIYYSGEIILNEIG